MKKIFTIIALTVLFSMNAQTFWFQGTGQNAIKTINATASGLYSTAMGGDTEASASYSTAMGVGTTASGYGSTAMGRTQKQVELILQQWEFHNSKWRYFYSNGMNTTASGAYSTAMGLTQKQVIMVL